jgi:hydroxymethylbilane synthase
MITRVILGTRGSELALAQTHAIAAAIRAIAPEVETVIEIIASQGDKIQNIPLAQMGGKGLFTKELEDALLEKRVDLAVHSLKDLPTELPRGLCLAAITEREDPRDVLVSQGGLPLAALPQGAKVGTSSLRRRAQLLAARPDLDMPDIRGNVPTRLKKVAEGNYDATLLALAGLKRLGLDAHATEVLPYEVMLPAPGQGALGIECREDDHELRALLARLAHPETAASVTAERALLQALGGGCHTPLGTWAQVSGHEIELQACVAALDGKQLWRAVVRGSMEEPVALGEEAARQLLAQGAVIDVTEATTPQSVGKPLAGKRVVVTRTRAQSSQLVEQLESLGAEVLLFPVISIAPVSPPPAIPAARNFDWVIFTSANAVSMFSIVLAEAEREIASYRACKICTVGPATASRCRDYGLTVSLTPGRYVADAIADALEQAEDGLAGKRILLPRGNLAREELVEQLRAKGATVADVVVYRTEAGRPTDAEHAALDAFQPDWVLFSSASTAENLNALLGDERMAKLKARARFAAIGPSTRTAAEALGIPIALEPERSDVPGLVGALAKQA